MINTDKTLLLHYHVDEQGNPIAVKIDNEVKQVSPIHHAVQLSQVPDEKHRMVIVDDLNNELIEVFNMDEIKENNYYINYTSSIVYFHPSKANKIYIFNYFGLGLEMVGASRIYDETTWTGEFIIRTIQEIIDKGRECIEALNTIGDAVKLLQRIENYIIVATELDIKLREDISIGNQLVIDLNNTIEIGTQLNTDLGVKINTGTVLRDDLIIKTNTANTSKTNLENATATADAKKTELDTSIANAQDDINTINARGNDSYIVLSTNWVGTEPNLTYTLNHGLNSKNLIVGAINDDTKFSSVPDFKYIDMNTIELQSTTKSNITVSINANYYSGKDANTVAQELIDARGGEVNLKSKINGIDTSINALNNEIITARGSDLTLDERLDGIDLDVNENKMYFLGELSKNSDSISNKTIKTTDSLSFKSINIIGDSISHGANVPKMYEDSWASILRKALNIEFDTKNYGYTNVISLLQNPIGTYEDLIDWDFNGGNYTLENTTDTLGFCKLLLTSSNTVIAKYRKDIKATKVYIGYKKELNSGQVKITVTEPSFIKSTVKVLDFSTLSQYGIVEFDTSNLSSLHSISFENISGTNSITGVYTIEDINKVVLNNYSRTGAKISDLGDNIINTVFNTNALIFALGHNDTNSESGLESYIEKCKQAWDLYKPEMYICNFIWTPYSPYVDGKLKELAKYCNAKYITIQDKVNDFNELVTEGFLSDGSHPTINGHKKIAEKVLASMNTSFKSKESIERYLYLNNSPNGSKENKFTELYVGECLKSQNGYNDFTNGFKDIFGYIDIPMMNGEVKNIYVPLPKSIVVNNVMGLNSNVSLNVTTGDNSGCQVLNSNISIANSSNVYISLSDVGSKLIAYGGNNCTFRVNYRITIFD